MSTELGPHTLALDGGDPPERALIGGKAWSIARMRALELPVPPAFVVTARACKHFLETGAVPDGLSTELARGIAWLEEASGRRFGGGARPLLVSVRSGAAISMPGMMDTVLNLGITDETEAILAGFTDPRFARDTHRRFLELYARIVLKGTLPDFDATAAPAQWRQSIEEATGAAVPDEPRAQLAAAVTAVFESWNSRRARRYRQHHGIPDQLGTAVTVQAMVFGNLDERSGTGVLFSRNPLTGDRAPYGEYLARAQGEDVVSGRYTPQPLSALAAQLPAVHAELLAAAATLEHEHGDVQDIEFTVEAGRLYLLQTRTAKRAPAAAVRFAVDMVEEGRIDEATALARVSAEQVRSLLRPRLADGAAADARCVARGAAACQGVGVGTVVGNPDEAERRALAGEAVVLARPTTSPEDVHGMLVARAVVTEQGGTTSHAALTSRDLGIPCVVGCGDGSLTALEGRTVTVDGASGCLYDGALPVIAPDEDSDPALALLTRWAAARAPLAVVSAAEDAFDLGAVDGGEDTARLPALLAGHTIVRGGAIASDQGVQAAVAAGVRTIVANPRLPVLLAALEAARS